MQTGHELSTHTYCMYVMTFFFKLQGLLRGEKMAKRQREGLFLSTDQIREHFWTKEISKLSPRAFFFLVILF